MGTFLQNLQTIATIRQQRDKMSDAVFANKARLTVLMAELTALQSNRSDNNREQITQLTEEIGSVMASLKQETAEYNKQKQLAEQETARIFIAPPQQQIESLWDSNPILLLPVRIETRFKVDNGQNVLWIRIFPDSIAVNTHEPWLTGTEIQSGQTYWTHIFNANGDPTLQQGAWTVMVKSYGVNRGTWVGLQTKPTNWGQAQKASQLVFPTQSVVKPYPWSNAPYCKVLPDRFVATIYSNNTVAYTAVGNFIPDTLITGPDPSDENSLKTDNQQQGDLKTREIIIGDGMNWMVDLSAAETKGMAIRVNITAQEAVNGFDKIVVLGIKFSQNGADSAQLLSDTLQAHRYSKEGFVFLPNGTPTKNTDQTDSGYSYTQEDEDATAPNYTLDSTPPNFKPTTSYNDKTDGQRLAEALLIPSTSLQSTPGSGNTDISDALYMNAALWPATMGYFLNEMLSPAVTANLTGQVQNFFQNLVTARGLLPSLRIGKEPYGLLVTSCFADWTWSEREGATQRVSAGGFLNTLLTKLDTLYSVWMTQVANVAYYGKTGDDFTNLMDVIGLQASTAEYYTRKAVTNAYSWNYLSFEGLNNTNLTSLWNIIQSIQKSWIQALGIDVSGNPQIASLIYLDRQDLIQPALVIDPWKPNLQPLPMTPLAAEKNYINWILQSSYTDVNQETFTYNGQPVTTPGCLLYMLLRNAYLQTCYYSILDLIATYQTFDPVMARSEVPIANMDPQQPIATKFDYFDADATKIFPPTVFPPTKSIPMGQAIRSPLLLHLPELLPLASHQNALSYLSGKNQDVLERCFTEHLDLCSYRLDAWITGLFNYRLQYLRTYSKPGDNKEIDNSNGTYIGAYGWVENIKPETANKVLVPQEQVPKELQQAGASYYRYTDNAGYIHGFSQNHAVAAAVLKNAYVSHTNQSDAGIMAVDLSSRRVRTALSYLDGVRNGQSLAALLGYQFERDLHEDTQLNLDQYIYLLRQQFPLVTNKTLLTEASDPTASIETTEANNVVDGLQLLEASRAKPTVAQAYPFQVTGLPATGTPEANAIIAAVEDIADAQDAIGDLGLAESVFQATWGNPDRTGALVKSLSEGNNPPEPDIVRTPRTGRPLTNRVILQLPIASGDTTWDTQLSPRANMEKGLNTWLEGVIGKPGKIRCQVCELVKGHDGKLTEIYHSSYSVQDLGLSILDVLYETGTRLGDGSSGVERRIAYQYRKDRVLTADKLVRVELRKRDDSWAKDTRTFYEVLSLLNAARVTVLESRSLQATDLLLPSDIKKAKSSNQNGFDTANMSARIKLAQTSLTTAAATLDTELGTHPVRLTHIRSAMTAIAAFGWVEFIPTEPSGNTKTIKETLVAQATTLNAKLKQALSDAASLIDHTNQTPGLTGTSKVNADASDYISAARLLLGESFTLLPRITFNNLTELRNAAAFSATGQLLSYAEQTSPFPLEEFIQGVAKVKPKMDALEKLILFNQLHTDKDLKLLALQLPWTGMAEDYWLAVPYPTTFDWSGDKLCLAMLGNNGFSSTNYCGLLIDDWSESIPNSSEITGIAMNINQPDAMPPQSLLLAVPSRINGHWTWQDLMNILNETLTRAKMRAIEPDDIDTTIYSPLIPTVLSAFSTAPVSITANFLRAVLVKEALVNPQPVTP